MNRPAACPGCGQTFEAFQKGGLLGCCTCYLAFEGELDRLLKRIHGVCWHQVMPVDLLACEPDEDLKALEVELQKAVNREAYEEAVALRDRILKLKTPERE